MSYLMAAMKEKGITLYEVIFEENKKLKEENEKLKEENKKLKETIDDTKEFLKVCDRNTDGYYEHYETRQIATRFEGGVYQKEEEDKK